MMGFFGKLFGRKEKPQAVNKFGIMAENQNKRVPAELNTAMYMLDEAFENDEQFLTLSLEKALYDGVYFVQAARLPNGLITVEVGIENENGTKLVEKAMDEVSCAKIMMHFLETAKVEDIESYTLVKMCSI